MVTVTGMTRRTLMRNRVSPIVVTGSVVALVTVGLIGPDPGTATDAAPAEVRVELVDRRPVTVVGTVVAAPPTVPTSASTTVVPSHVAPSTTVPVTTAAPVTTTSTTTFMTTSTTTSTAAPTTTRAPITVAPIDVRPLTADRWVAGDLPTPVAPGPADEAALRATAQRAWMALLVTRRQPGDPVPVAVGGSVRSGHAAQWFDDEVAVFAGTGRRAVPDPGIPSAITVLDLGLVGEDRAVVTVCTIDSDVLVAIDSDVLVAIDNGPLAGNADPPANGITRSVTRYGMVRADDVWLLDDLHVLDHIRFPSTDPEALQRC
jgi:hypothetical protein